MDKKYRVLDGLDACGVPPLALGVIAAGALLGLAWPAPSRISPDLVQFAIMAAGAAFLFTSAVMYATWRPSPVLAGWVGGLGIFMMGALSAGFLALRALEAGFPLVDARLAAIDEAMGFDHPAMLGWLAAQPEVAIVLRHSYASSVPIVLTLVLYLAWRGQFERLAMLLNLFVLTATLVALASTFTPAIGTYVHYAIAPEVIAALPKEAGLYHLPDFHMLRSGKELTLGPFNLAGITTFPSFHVCMALMVAYAMAGHPILKLIGYAYCAVTVVATVLIGGHYVIDLVGGAAVFGLSWLIIRGVPRLRANGAARPVYALPSRRPVA